MVGQLSIGQANFAQVSCLLLLHLQVTQGSSVVVTDLSAVTFCPFTKHPVKYDGIDHLCALSLFSLSYSDMKIRRFITARYVIIYFKHTYAEKYTIYKETIIIRFEEEWKNLTTRHRVAILSLWEYVLYAKQEKKNEGRRRTSQYRHYRPFVFRQTCRSDAVIFNHYRSPLVISERNIPALIARRDALRKSRGGGGGGGRS